MLLMYANGTASLYAFTIYDVEFDLFRCVGYYSYLWDSMLIIILRHFFVYSDNTIVI